LRDVIAWLTCCCICWVRVESVFKTFGQSSYGKWENSSINKGAVQSKATSMTVMVAVRIQEVFIMPLPLNHDRFEMNYCILRDDACNDPEISVTG